MSRLGRGSALKNQPSGASSIDPHPNPPPKLEGEGAGNLAAAIAITGNLKPLAFFLVGSECFESKMVHYLGLSMPALVRGPRKAGGRIESSYRLKRSIRAGGWLGARASALHNNGRGSTAARDRHFKTTPANEAGSPKMPAKPIPAG